MPWSAALRTKMRERLGECVENAFVEIGVLPGDFQGDFLVAQLGHIANDAREAAEKLLDGHHADLHHRFLQFAENARLKRERVGKLRAQRVLGVAAVEFGDGALQHGFADDQLADQIHHGVDAAGVHAQRIFGAAWAMPMAAPRDLRAFVAALIVREMSGLTSGGDGGGFGFDENFEQVARSGLRRHQRSTTAIRATMEGTWQRLLDPVG